MACVSSASCVTRPDRGRCLVTTKAIVVGETILEERPLVALPLPDSADAALLCDSCLKECASPASQMMHAADLTRKPKLPLGDDEECASFPCPGGCDLLLCSPSCVPGTGHQSMCSRGADPASDRVKALNAFEEYARSTDEAFLFGARLVAMVHAQVSYIPVCTKIAIFMALYLSIYLS